MQHGIQIGKAGRLSDEQHFKLFIADVYIVLTVLNQTADAAGIAECPEEVVPLKGLTVSVDDLMFGADIAQIPDAFEKVGEASPAVFHGLRRAVGSCCKRAERGDIAEIAPFIAGEASRVYGCGAAGENVSDRLFRLVGKLHTGGKVIGTAGGNIAQRRVQMTFEHTVDDFIQGAVAAHAGDDIKAVAVLADKFRKPEVYETAGYDYKIEDLAPSLRSKMKSREIGLPFT